MTNREISAPTAFRNVKANGEGWWNENLRRSFVERQGTSATGWIGASEVNSVRQRLERPVFIPAPQASFGIDATTRVFAIGSCFAREIERALSAAKYPVLSDTRDVFASNFSANSKVLHRNYGDEFNFSVVNKYNVFSLLQHLQWIFGESAVPFERSLLDCGEELFQDPQVSSMHRLADYDTTRRTREMVDDHFRRIVQAQLVILTLGLTETWFDRDLGLYLNTAPHPRHADSGTNRFVFRTTTFNENLECLNSIHALLHRHVPAPPKMVISVSPVPTICSFHDSDVAITNTASKSTLRAVADEFAASGKADYFPSYEMVMLSDPETAWLDDKIHVRPGFIDRIVDVFLTNYLNTGV